MSDQPRPTPETREIVLEYEARRASVGDIIEHAESLERERDEAMELLREYESEVPSCIRSATNAHLQNSEQLSVIGILRRFGQICSWYYDEQREKYKAIEQRDRLAAAGQRVLDAGGNFCDLITAQGEMESALNATGKEQA